jgi:hypothetical protein
MVAAIEHDLPRLVLEKPPENTPEPEPEVDDNDALARFLVEIQRLVARYPYIARSIAASFVAEGHLFVETPEGQAWFDALSQSDLIRRGQLIWEAYALDNLIDTEPDKLPSVWIDTFATAASHTDLESILSMLLVQEVRDGSLRS